MWLVPPALLAVGLTWTGSVTAALAVVGVTTIMAVGAPGKALRAVRDVETEVSTSHQSSPDPVLVVSDGVIVSANPAAAVLFGGELVGASTQEVLGIEVAASPARTRATSIVSGGHIPLCVDILARPVWFGGAIATELTLLSVVEAGTDALSPAVGSRLDLLFDRIPVALYRSTPEGDVIAANPALADMLGLADPGDLIGAVARAHAHYRDRDGRAQWLAMFEDRDVVLNYDVQLTRSDGTVITATDSARAVRNREGEILFFEGVMVDVTEQREVEEARRRNSEILEATSDLVWLTDEDDRITRLNASMRAFLGQDVQVHGEHVTRFVMPTDDARALAAWRAAAEGPRVWEGELTLRSAAGREILTSAVAQRHRNFVSLVARDITEERRTARMLESLVRAKDEFIASVSHELRTPLTAVVGLASELDSHYQDIDESTRQDFIRLVADQSTEVAAIVEDLLVAARADTDSITLVHEEVDLAAAVTAVMAALPHETRQGFEVSGSGRACGDAQRIRQILRNLVTNAVRYGDLPGVISIGADGPHTVVTVSDKGPGIDPAMAERVFQPYVRAHATVTQPNSVGLGLSVSRWLAEKMGGSLVYENEVMSTFVLRLPAVRCR